MEQEYKVAKGKQAFKILVLICAFCVLCFLCAVLGYYFARTKSPLNKAAQEETLNEYNLPKESHAPFHLPTLNTEENVTVSPSFLPTSETTEYFVIAEHGAVNLYALTQSGEKKRRG